MDNRFRSLVTALAALTLLTLTPTFAAPITTPTPTTSPQAAPADDKTLDEVDINRFVDTITTIKNNYAKPINDQKLLENAIRGMVNNLDPHSEYLDENAYKALMTTTSGAFGGIGIEVSTEYGVLKVVTPIDDTPCLKSRH